MRISFTSFFLWTFITVANGQTTILLDLTWQENEGRQLALINEGYDSGNLPVVFRRIPLSGSDSIRVTLVTDTEKRFGDYHAPERLPGQYRILTRIESDQGQFYGSIFLYPIRSNSQNDVSVLLTGRLEVTIIPGRPRVRIRSNVFTRESVLSKGQLIKIPILESNVYRINYEQLPTSWTNQNFDPSKIQVFAGHRGHLPYGVGDERTDDLQEVPCLLDGNFTQSGDGLIFYADGSHITVPSDQPGYMTVRHNVYSDTNFYFIRYGVENGLRMAAPPALNAPPPSPATTGSAVWRYEKDNYNILEGIIQGSGRTWYTDAFTGTVTRDYSDMIRDLPIDMSQNVMFSTAFAGRSDFRNTVSYQVGDRTFSAEMLSVQMSDRYGIGARIVPMTEKLALTSKQLILRHETRQSNSRGWLDFLELAYFTPLQYRNETLLFHTTQTGQAYEVGNTQNDLLVMDCTTPYDTKLVPVLQQQDKLWFYDETSGNAPGHFAVFDPALVTKVSGIKPVPNQNLHGLEQVDYVIVFHPLFRQPAQQLADHRREHNGFEVRMANIYDIYNEFSSGKTDPSALRNFLKMLYSRNNENLRVVLFGDGSFNYKHNPAQVEYRDESFIPVFETENSYNPIRAFPSDDYYALLDDWEGGELRGALDISLGRIPVRTQAEAEIMVRKIIAYETDPARFGDWRKDMLLVADDGNYNLFVGYTERLSASIEEQAPPIQISKAYVDAFVKEGLTSPKTNTLINNNAFDGRIIINYQGHGNSKGWADEAILTKIDLSNWNNYLKYPVLVTATCTFGGYDDPKEVTAGEYSLVLPEKGAIALFTTTRVVYANSNDRLTNSLFDRLMDRLDDPPELGEWIRLAKNANRSDTLDINSRKFTLLGDPALKIAVPRYQVIVTEINGKDPSTSDSIRIGALEKVTIKGYIGDHQGQKLSSFNGELAPTLFDKKKILETLGQGNENYQQSYPVWQNVIFKGRASVNQGEFQFEFIVPRDIDYSIGPGRLSLYADDGMTSDAWGSEQSFLIGGTATNPVEDDGNGPAVDIYLGDKNFIEGDEVEQNTMLILDIEDISGINVSGNGIGHDLVYYLDGQSGSETVLNNYFRYDLNSFSRGSVEFPLSDLEAGKHKLTIKVWDSYNNLTEKSVEFYVNKKELAISNVLNYPNPFFDRTEFQFENPLIGDDLTIVIDIFTPSGRMAHRIIENRNSTGQLVRGIYWDGRDQWQQKLANGVYIYKIKVIEQSGNKTTHLDSDFQKLLLLN